MEDNHGLGGRPRCVDHGAAPGTDTVTPHTRPPSDDDADHALVRTALCIGGTVEMDLVCEPAFDYGRVPGEWTLGEDEHRAEATGADQTIRLQTDMLLGIEAGRARARHVLRDGETVYCALAWGDQAPLPTTADEAAEQLEATTLFWRDWLARAAIPDHSRAADPAIGANDQGPDLHADGADSRRAHYLNAETPGGERNGDTAIPGSATRPSCSALHYLMLDWEADEFMQFLADVERNEDGGLQIMYGIDGRRDLTESVREELSGYGGARPVRLGNGAFDQQQNDVFGAALDSVLLHTRRSQRLPRRLWPLVQTQAEGAKAVWRQPDQGIWEARGEPQHYVSSKLMCWVALDRAAQLAHIRGEARSPPAGRKPPRRSRPTSSSTGWTSAGPPAALRDRRARRLDAPGGDLRIPAGDDPRLRATVLAIADELSENGFVLRYRTEETDDGLSGKEGTFVICSFWLVSALAIVGEIQRARDLMERLVKAASPLGLYAEEYDVDTGRHLGNFPQAFSHLALAEAAARIIVPRAWPKWPGELYW